MKAIRFIMCVAVGVLLMFGANSCENKKNDSASESSKEKTEKSENSDNSGDVNAKSDKLVLIDFYATWCGPCKTMAPIVKEMEEKYGDNLEFRKVDIDEDPELAEKYRIDAVPTFVILSTTGEEIDRIVGALDAERMDETLWEIINVNTVK